MSAAVENQRVSTFTETGEKLYGTVVREELTGAWVCLDGEEGDVEYFDNSRLHEIYDK